MFVNSVMRPFYVAIQRSIISIFTILVVHCFLAKLNFNLKKLIQSGPFFSVPLNGRVSAAIIPSRPEERAEALSVSLP